MTTQESEFPLLRNTYTRSIVLVFYGALIIGMALSIMDDGLRLPVSQDLREAVASIIIVTEILAIREIIPAGWWAIKHYNEKFNQAQRGNLDQVWEQEREKIRQLYPTPQPAPEQQIRPPINREGYVYLVRSESGYYKIGRTHNPNDRMRTFKVKLPFDVEYEHLIKTDDMYTLERTLHNRFWRQRVNGEWFELSADDVTYIKGLNTNGLGDQVQ